MLKLRISSDDLGYPWRWTGTRLAAGGSWIEPYPHPALEQVSATDGAGAFFAVVRERCSGSWTADPAVRFLPQPEFTHALAMAREWPADFLLIETSPTGPVRLSAGTHGVAPVYLTVDDGVLHGSWDICELAGHIDARSLSEREAARLLTLRLRYTYDTVVADVYRLTERATITATGSGLEVSYPAPALHSRPRPLRDGADVLTAYETLLEHVIAARGHDLAATAVELSGGLDSANIALSLASCPDGFAVTPAAMILEGERGAQQRRRRAELIARAGFAPPDVTVDAAQLVPFHPDGERARGHPVSPYDEPYHEAMGALHTTLAARGARWIFTGVGGDEMVALTAQECPRVPVGTDRPFMPWIGERTREAARNTDIGTAPAAVVNEMTLMSLACAAPLILKAGCWPIHPFADPALIRFGEWLPESWRADKHLHRARLARLGLSQNVLNPPLPETLTAIMDLGLRQYGAPLLRRLLDEGAYLIEQGFVNPHGLAEACERIERGKPHQRDRELYGVLAIELVIHPLS